jgi:hypothetical protein
MSGLSIYPSEATVAVVWFQHVTFKETDSRQRRRVSRTQNIFRLHRVKMLSYGAVSN